MTRASTGMATPGALDAGAAGALNAGAAGAEGGDGENEGRGVDPGKAVTAAGAIGLVSGTMAGGGGGFIGAGLASIFGWVGGGNADAGDDAGEVAPGKGGNGGRPDGSSAARLGGMAGTGSGGGGEAKELPGNGGKAEPPGAGNDGSGASFLAPGRGGNGERPGLFRLGGFDGNGTGAGGGGVPAPGKGGRAGKALLLPVKGNTMSLALP